MSLISRFIVSFAIVFFSFSSSFGQYKYDLKQFGNETSDFLKQPGKWNGEDLLTLGIILGGTFGLMHIDDDVRAHILENGNHLGKLHWEFGRYWGEPVTSVALSTLFILHGALNDNTANKKLGFEIGQSFAYTVGTIGVFKNLLSRARPCMGTDPFTFKPITFSDDYWSLPSGHTGLAFSLSTVLSGNIKSDFMKGAVYIPAIITAVSRVYYNRHWTSDVFLGACAGYFIGKFVTDLHKEEEEGIFSHKPVLSFSIPM